MMSTIGIIHHRRSHKSSLILLKIHYANNRDMVSSAQVQTYISPQKTCLLFLLMKLQLSLKGPLLVRWININPSTDM